MISLICGAMYSGKTTEVIRRLHRAHIAGKKTILLRPITDTRGFLSHSGLNISWLEEKFVENLNNFNTNGLNTVGIDEGQFHKGLTNFCVNNSLAGKHIIISALHATSECEMFQNIAEIIPYCEEIEKLNAVCTKCGSDFGNYTFYTAGEKTDKIVVGGSESYTALCDRCYHGSK
jgi:thymidine kinase